MNSVASFFVSRVDTNVDKRLDGLGARRPQGHGRDRQRAGGIPRASARSSRGERWDRAGGGRRRRAAAAVGVDRHQEPRSTRTRCTSTTWSPLTPSTRCRWRRCSRSPTTREPIPALGGDRPDGRAGTPWPTPGSTSATVTDELLVDGVEQFEDAMNRLLDGIDQRRAAVRLGTPPDDPGASAPGAAWSGVRSREARRLRGGRPRVCGGTMRRCGADPGSRRSRTGSGG